MCGRVVCAMSYDELVTLNKGKAVRNGMRYNRSYNLTPTKYLPTMNNEEVEMMKWGTKNKDNIPVINARSETIISHGYFKNYKRCVIIIQGYYEWSEIKDKNVFYFHDREGKLIYLAGLYREATDEVLLCLTF
jgi:putative SOS response-associated peptidase YedK